MGRRQFWRWVEQANKEQEAVKAHPGSWRDTEQDPGWQAMREKRERWRGR